ncbi:MAG: hypothetical protein ACRDDY_15000, partial [Clostridium sp.]|uniref:hypothetical protein n=1 Tax=Clostridium sp. TaxID=1506 RepID=UPI003EE68F9C
MKKRKFRVFLTCFLFFVICSSFVSAIAKPIEEKNNSIYTEEHEHNKDCIISTDSEEKNGTDDETSDDNSLNENSDIETEENKDSVITEENNVEEGLEEENKNKSEEAPKDENKKEPEKEEREYKNPTPDTFESVIGEYSLTTILNKINIFSFQKITASHIVGPIIAKEAYREDNRTGRLMFADYTNGNPSYIEVIR